MPATRSRPTVDVDTLASRQGWRRLSAPLVLLAVAVLALAAYGSGLGVGFVSDDHYWLLSAVRGQWRHAFDLVPHTSALPFETLLHSLKYGLFGYNAVGFHLFDLGAHIGACFLLYQFARGIGLGSAGAAAAALLGAVATAPSQAVSWTSADEHVWATLLALASLVLYIAYRTDGRRLLLAGAILLAVIAALTKVEGTAVFFGVLAYELVWRPSHPFSVRSVRGRVGWGPLALRIAPFAASAALFFAWELTATDRLRGASRLGLNMIPRAAEVIRTIVLPYNPADLLSPAHTHRILTTLAALAATVVAVLLAACIIAAFARRSVIGLCLLWVGPLLPALSLTDALQPRYTYLPTLVSFLFVATGAAVLLDWFAARRLPAAMLRAGAAVALVGLLAVGIRGTAQGSSDLRAAETESQAFSAAVLADHPVFIPNTTIFLIGSHLDAGSARWVFADPRLPPGINKNVPKKIEYAPSVAAVALRGLASPILIYEREPSGRYVERFL
jgi:hypothetical protein